ncbi:hypothetical protein CALVIDRAFT_301062 [Calocera viscosa TUFC12733]|uniref:Uncharacterized protein n=1 Tax=Calocera viscosa (strain TUFC12733) TaxID=1330018 RepID=A0A167IIF7_CALVF|nr:hypothetical protein CALVIDRAFT_301062 [Calocera viscosa TUFC12733]
MAVATASNPVTNPYDEMVVPALRKRLEAESRVLSSRMSGNFDAFSIPDAPSFSSHPSSSPLATTTTTSTTPAPPSSSINIPSSKSRARVASPELYSKPSSIPRPSLQMSASNAQYTRELLTGTGASAGRESREGRERERERGTRSDRIPQGAVMRDMERDRDRDRDRERERDRDRDREREKEAEMEQQDREQERTPRARSRTQSTPYAYNELVAAAAAATAAAQAEVPSVLPTPASSRANSPLTNGTNGAYGPNTYTLAASVLPSRPSGIPVPRSGSAARPSTKTPGSRSRSRNATSPVGYPASAEDGSGAADDLLSAAGRMRYPPSPEPSPELSYIRNVQAPFPLSGSVMAGAGSDSEAGRSSFERDMRASRAARSRRGERERQPGAGGGAGGRGELELNYRGDTTRNGGRGEVYKEHTEEQLEIATFGHDLSMERKALNAAVPRRRGEFDHLGVLDGTPRKGSAPSPSQQQQAAWGELAHAAGVDYGAEGEGYESAEYELHEESVIRERPLTWMVEGEASVTDLVLESLHNEGGRQSLTFPGQGRRAEEENWEMAYEQMPPAGLAYEPKQPQEREVVALRNGAGTASKVEPMQFSSRGQPQSVLSQSAPIAQRPVEAPPALPNTKAEPKMNGSASTNTVAAHARQPTSKPPTTPAARQRVASKPSKVSGPSASSKGNAQPRSKSHPANLHQHQYRDSNSSMSLVDAIPDVPKRGNERGKNWDEVVLPTVARQLGLDSHENGPPEPAEVREEMVPPAPGTFGYDHSKYKAPLPMDRHIPSTPRPTSPESADGHLVPPEQPTRRHSKEVVVAKPPPQPLIAIPPRQPSPAPFSDYIPLAVQIPPPPPIVRPQPVLQKSSTALDRGKDLRNSKPPKIKISPPGDFAMDVAEDDDKVSGGCKCCVVM